MAEPRNRDVQVWSARRPREQDGQSGVGIVLLAQYSRKKYIPVELVTLGVTSWAKGRELYDINLFPESSMNVMTDPQLTMFDLNEYMRIEATPERVQEVFVYWQSKFGYEKRRLTATRTRHIKLALKHYTLRQLKTVLDYAAQDPGTRGQNRNNRPYDDIPNIFRNEERIDLYLTLAARVDRRASGLVPDDRPHESAEF